MIIFNKNQQGIGIIKLLFLIPLVLIGLVILFYIYTELNKAYWDSKVRALCEKDGGVTVYEVVNLTKDEYLQNEGKNGLIRVMSKRTSKKEHQYAFVSKTNVINAKKPYVRRTEYVTYRKADNKQLG
ncbi:MAG: hypothetical protein K9K86_11700, partial [Pseudomonadales bacterium]|nr:hypothetical protein [Pseudomonadales bacterium]